MQWTINEIDIRRVIKDKPLKIAVDRKCVTNAIGLLHDKILQRRFQYYLCKINELWIQLLSSYVANKRYSCLPFFVCMETQDIQRAFGWLRIS